MIYTTYFAKLKKLPNNIIPVSICAKPPTGYKGKEFKKLAPTYDILMSYKQDHNEEKYIKKYNNEVLRNLITDEVVYDLYELIGVDITGEGFGSIPNGGADVALVCYEKSDSFCHRHLVAEWLKLNGYKCKEWE